MTARSRVRRRQARRVANRRQDWRITVVMPVGSSGVSAALPLPLLRRVRWDPALVDRIGRAAEHYAHVNRLEIR